MINPWSVEIWRISALSLAALIVGLMIGHPFLILSLTSMGYLAWIMSNLYRLESWLRKGGSSQPPNGNGIWEEIYLHFYRIRERNRKRKRKLAEVISRFRDSTAAMPDATVVLGASGEIDWYNDAAAKLLGLRSPQDIGQRLVNLIRHPDFINYLESRQYSTTLELPSPVDDKTMLAVNIIPYGNDQRLFVARDITRIKQLEMMRRDFVANVSHELRTPLTVINGFLETMSDADDSEQLRQWRHSLQLMRQHTYRMQHIVDDLLLLSRLELENASKKSASIFIPGLLKTIQQEAISLSAERQHQITLDVDSGLCLIGNEKELYSAFSNLVANAVRYTPSGGRIVIRWFADIAGAHFRVSDTGIGIAHQHISRLTERFYRVDVGRSRESGGTGLGLAIVKHVLERYDAKLRIDSKPGEGSTFTCDFPPRLINRKQADQQFSPDDVA